MKILGSIGGLAVILLVFTERDAIRVISARKATRKEKEYYAKHLR